MSQPGIDLTSELLRGMRLSGVNYRRIETARPFGVGFSAVAGKAQFHFISHGPVLLRMASGEQFTLESGDILFTPNGDGHVLLSDPQATVVNVARLSSETVCSTVSCTSAGGRPDCPKRAVTFSGCVDFGLGGIQPLVKTMPKVMRVSSLLNTWPEIQSLLVAMERESLTRQVGYAGILARLAVQYIAHEGQALETIASSLGYQSLAAFSRAFKRITDQPPGALRATAR